MPRFQSPVHRVSHCYRKQKRICPILKNSFSPLFIGSLIVTATRPSLWRLSCSLFQSPVHRVSHCYSHAAAHRSPFSLTFSPLFIGSLIVTLGMSLADLFDVVFQSPVHRVSHCYSRCCRQSIVIHHVLSVPCSSGLSLLRGISPPMVRPIITFQSPVHRVSHCYSYLCD